MAVVNGVRDVFVWVKSGWMFDVHWLSESYLGMVSDAMRSELYMDGLGNGWFVQ